MTEVPFSKAHTAKRCCCVARRLPMKLPSKPEQPAEPSHNMRKGLGWMNNRSLWPDLPRCETGDPVSIRPVLFSAATCRLPAIAVCPCASGLLHAVYHARARAAVHYRNHDGLQPSRVAAPHGSLLSLSLKPALSPPPACSQTSSLPEPAGSSPSSKESFMPVRPRLSLDVWAVVLALLLALTVRFGLIRSVPW